MVYACPEENCGPCSGYHLHQFKIGGKRYTESPEEPDEGVEEKAVRLCEVVRKAPAEFCYRYDFGDGWDHTIVAEKISSVPNGYAAVLKCLQGAKGCPPEDVGGVPEYERFRKAY